MALSSMVSKSSSVVPLAVRAISCGAGSLHGSIITATISKSAVLNGNHGNLEQDMMIITGRTRQFSTVAVAKKLLDTSLLNVLRSEIKSAKKSNVDKQVPPRTPPGFEFKINDNPGERWITLTRQHQDETIEVRVEHAVDKTLLGLDNSDEDSTEDSDSDDNKEDDDTKEENESDDNNDSDSDDDDSSSGGEDSDTDNNQEDKEGSQSLEMTVTVSKKDGRSLKFELTATANEINVDNMSLVESAESDSNKKFEFSAPDFEQLDHNLQNAFVKYLEIRGIRMKFVYFLQEYVEAKSQNDDVLWFKKLKKFVKN